MTKAYPVFIKQVEKDYLVYVPDMEIYTEGNSISNAIEMATDAIGLKGINLEDDGISLPEPGDYASALQKAQAYTEDIDYSTGILTLVNVNFDTYRKKVRNKAVKKNCTIPYWISVAADNAGINYSRVLQDALIKILHLNASSIYYTGDQ